MRLKLVRNCEYGLKGETVVIDDNTGNALIKTGQAILTKDMVPDEYRISGSNNGKPIRLRPDGRSKR